MVDALVPTAPDAVRRPRGHVNTKLRTSVLVLVASLLVTALTWLSVAQFDGSLHLSGGLLLLTRLVELVIVLGVLAVPFCGVRGLLCSLASRRLVSAGDLPEARIKAEDAVGWHWYVVGFGLTAIVVSFALLLLGSNDGKVRSVLFNWQYLDWSNTSQLAKGFWLNVKLFMVAEVLVLIWGLMVAVARMLPGKACAPVRFLAIAYTDLFRGMPAIVVIYLIVFGVQLAKLPGVDHFEPPTRVFWLGVIALVLVYGAYVAEVYRSGLDSIHWSQTAAARSLGLSHGQTLRYVVVPQAVRRILPPLLNDFVGLQKDTALLSIVGLVEIFQTSVLLKNRYFNLTAVVGAAIAFVVITIPLARYTDRLIKKDKQRTRANG